LPDDVDEDKITASVKDGVLTIEIPTIKEKTSLKEKLIEIK
jgi:HSP20 family molecular chaperone IbpA